MPALKLSPSLNLLVFYLFFIGWQIPNPYLFFLSLCNGPNFFLLLFTDLEGLPIRSLFSGHRILSVYGELDLLSLEEPSDEAQLPVNPTISCLLISFLFLPAFQSFTVNEVSKGSLETQELFIS